LIVLLGIVAIAVFLPIAGLVDGLEGWHSFSRAWQTAHEQVIRSLGLCALCAGVALLFAWPLARQQLQTRGVGNRILDLLTLLPLAIPGSIVGVGFIIVWNRPYLDWMMQCWFIMPVLLLARFFPLAQKSLVIAFGMVHSSLWESAVLAPRHKVLRLIRIEIPLVKRGMLVAALAVFVLAFRELSATVLVTPPGCETLALRTYTLSHYGADDLIMALCLMSIGVVIAGYILALMLLKKK
jgi:iron(III) transport system permease protein